MRPAVEILCPVSLDPANPLHVPLTLTVRGQVLLFAMGVVIVAYRCDGTRACAPTTFPVDNGGQWSGSLTLPPGCAGKTVDLFAYFFATHNDPTQGGAVTPAVCATTAQINTNVGSSTGLVVDAAATDPCG